MKGTKPRKLTVEQYAKTRIGWRGHSVNPSYIYKLIKQFEQGLKSERDIGFKVIYENKRLFIDVL